MSLISLLYVFTSGEFEITTIPSIFKNEEIKTTVVFYTRESTTLILYVLRVALPGCTGLTSRKSTLTNQSEQCCTVINSLNSLFTIVFNREESTLVDVMYSSKHRN